MCYFLVPEGALQPEVLWGSQEEEKFAARNILTNEPPDFSNSTHANYWLAKEGEVEDKGFVVRVGNSKRKIVGVRIRNTNTNETKWATRTFKLEGSLLKEPERITQRAKENTAQWTPEILKAEGEWYKLLNVTLEDNQTLQSFFFDGTTELRYLWFHLLSFYGEGGGLHYFAPILQSGECDAFSFFHLIFKPIRCVHVDQLDKLRLVLQRDRPWQQDKKTSEEGN